MRGKLLTAFSFILIGHFLFAEPAYAYIDLATGSVILQSILAAVVALSIALKLYWHRLMKFIGFKKNEVRPAEDTTDERTNTEDH